MCPTCLLLILLINPLLMIHIFQSSSQWPLETIVFDQFLVWKEEGMSLSFPMIHILSQGTFLSHSSLSMYLRLYAIVIIKYLRLAGR